ncbi:MAG: L-threonylcarbamoyladenylate synthase [bacterium]
MLLYYVGILGIDLRAGEEFEVKELARLLKTHAEHPDIRLIRKAAEALKGDKLIAYPTDTVYGLGASLFSKKAIEKIYMLKPHKKKKPLTFVCADLKDISRYAQVSDAAYRIMKKLAPGPYTFILNATREVPRLMMTPRKTVGIRVPDNEVCQAIIAEIGNPIISTTAMSQDREYLDDPDDIMDSLGHALEYVIDIGRLPYELSTVIDLTDCDTPVIIRQGKGDISGII